MMNKLALIAALAAFSLPGAGAAQSVAPTGIWLTQNGDAQVRIASCGDALCGTIVWAKETVDPETGRPLTDKHNPDPAKRDHAIVGTTIMFGMRPNGAGRWSGHFYNTRDGGTYDGNLIVTGDATVKAEGCMLICMGETWQKIENAKPAAIGNKPAPGGKKKNGKA